ncbi:MAG TPA: helix-turn-helix transcriptional regulator [Thermoanaerobaculia bacterium]|nr:helix-turn-helix transcriptional regulator [Thermoanaerobaculia bacterium]
MPRPPKAGPALPPAHWRARLRLALDRSGMKRGIVAMDAGINRATLSRIVNDENYHPSFEVVARIARAANASVGWLLREQGYTFSAEERAELREAAAIIIRRTT